jgi:hypothetical protein
MPIYAARVVADGAMLKAGAIEYAGETTRRPHERLRSQRPFAALHLSCCEGQGEETE